MIAVRPDDLPSSVPLGLTRCRSEPCRNEPCRSEPRAGTKGAFVTIDHIFVPREPVRVPDVHRLAEPQALAQARAGIAQALEELREVELALEQQLADLRGFLDRRARAAINPAPAAANTPVQEQDIFGLAAAA